MNTLEEIKTAIAHLPPREKAMLAAELFAQETKPESAQLEVALERGLQDVEAGRVRPVEEVRAMLSGWATKS
jgi:predicted transcriptional regulator